MTFRVGHISDLHIWEFENPGVSKFLNKRLVGGLNLLLHRGDAHSVGVVEHALNRFDELDVDHVCISGDLTNLALPSEFRAAKHVVDGIHDAHRRVSLVPGNHDYYTYEAERERRFETTFADYLYSDMPAYQQESGYPFVHLRDDVAIIGLNSGIATPPLMATGTVRETEVRALEALLKDPEITSRFALVMVHHPLTPNPNKRIQASRKLTNDEEVLSILRHGGVDLVIHGHNHQFSAQRLPLLNGPGDIHIVEAGSTSTVTHPVPEFCGTFNIFEIADGHLERIETHLFEGFDQGFVHWQEQTFERSVL